jgi:glycosyltransferase involved in cell wall biosynthesis
MDDSMAQAPDQLADAPLSAAICIGTFNQAQYLRGSVESAIAQTYPIHEIWVVDDASTDNTPAVMEQLCAEYPQLRYYRHPVNVGPARNLSFALAQPMTDLVARLDSDDRLEPTYVAVLAELMRQHPQAGYAHCNVWELDGEGHRARLRQITRSHAWEDAESALRSNISGLRTAANCILFRTRALKEMDYYLTHPAWTFSEDWELALRMAIAGWGNVYSPQVMSNYRQWEDPQGARARRKMMEVSTNIAIYKDTLIPEYERRGWSIALIQRSMRTKAIRFADALDSPRFTAEDRVAYKALLRELGSSAGLSFAMWAAESGFNPIVRKWNQFRQRAKDAIKSLLFRSKSAGVAA